VADEEAGRVLTLDRLLEYVTSTPGQVRLAIETKHPTRHSGRVEVALIETLRRFGLVVGGSPVEWSGRPAVRVMSFSSLALRQLRVLAPELPAVHLVSWIPPRGGTTPPSAITAVGAPISLLRRYPGYVARVQSADKEVHVWTVNDERDIDLVLSLGVDAVITDRPGEVLRRLGRTFPATGQRPGVSRQPTPPGQECSGA
jgi:glycerophosphoryl diester phosphodiesterase